jgi:hypothetical protein
MTLKDSHNPNSVLVVTKGVGTSACDITLTLPWTVMIEVNASDNRLYLNDDLLYGTFLIWTPHETLHLIEVIFWIFFFFFLFRWSKNLTSQTRSIWQVRIFEIPTIICTWTDGLLHLCQGILWASDCLPHEIVRYKPFIDLDQLKCKTGWDINMRYRRVEGRAGMYETGHRVQARRCQAAFDWSDPGAEL